MLVEPSADTLAQLTQAPEASASRAHLWIFLSALVGALLAGLINWLVRILTAGAGGGPTPLDLVFLSPVIGLVVLAVFIILVNLMLLIAHLFGGKGVYWRLAYAAAAGLAPLILISLPLSAIPIVAATDLLLICYALFLLVLAIKAVSQIDWSRAILSLLLAVAILGALGGCFVVALLPFLPR